MITLHPDEEILLTRRRHWLPLLFQLFSLGVTTLVPLTLLLGTEFMPYAMQLQIAGYRLFLLFLFAAWLSVLWMGMAITWTNHELDVLVVTTKRVIDVEQKGLFARDLAELRMENIQDIRVEVNGFIRSLLNYGDLSIQTAGEHAEFAVRNFHDPNGIREAIAEAHDRLIAREKTSYLQGSPSKI